MERILRSLDATLLVLHVMTASRMPKKVYMEEVIELMVTLIRYHLQHNIFPEYDPIYKVESETKGTTSSFFVRFCLMFKYCFINMT